MDLHVISPRSDNAAAVAFFSDLLLELGQRYDLILVDWWQDRIVELRDPAAVAAYLQMNPTQKPMRQRRPSSEHAFTGARRAAVRRGVGGAGAGRHPAAPAQLAALALGGLDLPAGRDARRRVRGHARSTSASRRLIEIAVATLATDRALLLLGVPGTAKSWVSEHLAAAIAGDSTLLVQGTAGTSEEAIRYGWNYARLLAEGPSQGGARAQPADAGDAARARSPASRS